MRIVYVHSTVLPPPTDPQTDRFRLLSETLEGDVLHPIWFRTPEEVEAVFGRGSYPVHTVGRFRYHWFLTPSARGIRSRLALFRFYVRKGRELYRERPFDCIVAYSHMTTGLCAAALKFLTGARLVIEIATSPPWVYISERPRPRLRERVMKLYSDVCLHMTMMASDRAHFLYPNLLAPWRLLRSTPNSVFHEFVPVSKIDRSNSRATDDRYVLMVGAPWYLKGADILIRAFQDIAPEFPDVKLKLMGFYPDRKELDEIIGGTAQIEVLKPRPHPEAIKVIQGAMVLVLPSRCEGLGRVLLEAMAAGVPVIGSEVGGIPVLVRDGENGFLIPREDGRALTSRLRQLLSDEELRRRMGDAGYRRAHEELNETVYVQEFTKMVRAAIDGKRAD